MTALYILLAAFAGSFIQSASGFGYAIVVMSILPLFIPFQSAAIVEVLSALAMVLWIAVKYRRHIHWKLLWWPLVANSVFSLAGIWFQDAGTETLLRRILGVTLVVLSIYFIFFSSRLVIRANLWTGLAAGAISGVCGGLMSIGGPPMVAYYLAATRSKEEYAATLQTYFVFSTIYIFAAHVAMGHVTGQILSWSALALVGLAAGTFCGLKLFDRLSADGLKKVVCGFMAVVGCYLVITG